MSVGIVRNLALCAVLLDACSAGQTAYATEFDAAMESILTEYLKVHTALAADSTEGVVAAIDRIEKWAEKLDPDSAAAEHFEHYKSIRQRIITACKEFDDSEDISSVREAFKELSKPISMWVTMAKPEGKHAMYCPMENAGWVQEGSEVANPYYGTEMLECGYEVDDSN
jgi:Cu(I)/Ag(I) efflux system membrane fusion protein